MLKKKTESAVPAFALAAVLAAGAAVPAFASTPGFSANLPAFQANITAVAGSKDYVTSKNAYVQLDSGSNRGIFWVDRHSVDNRATASATVGSSQGHTLPCTSSSWSGTALLRACQVYWGTGTDHVSGWVNFDS